MRSRRAKNRSFRAFAPPLLFSGFLIASTVSAYSETVVLKQNFDEFVEDFAGTEGSEGSEGGAWKEFGKQDTSPQVTDQEFHPSDDGNTGKSIRITRDDSAITTPDFWLIGSWAEPLETGKIRISFRFLRDTADSGFSFHIGNSEKNAGVNTVAVSVGNRSTSLEKLGVMTIDGTWQTIEVPLAVGVWMQVALDIDFSSTTYTVSVDGESMTEAIPFEWNGPLQRVSFLPTHPDGNVSFIDDVEVTVLD